MPDQGIFEDAAARLTEIKTATKNAEDLVSFLKSVGEDTKEQEAKLRDLKVKSKRWEDALTKRGVKLPK